MDEDRSPDHPRDSNCDYGDQKNFPNVWDQCACDNEITVIPDDVAWMRQLLVDRVMPWVYGPSFANGTIPINSCDPVNLALIWLASCDNRDSGEIRQRFALATFFYQLNGTKWDYTDGWLSEMNECLWLGVQCNNRDAVNSLAVDTNNIFGEVRTNGSYRG